MATKNSQVGPNISLFWLGTELVWLGKGAHMGEYARQYALDRLGVDIGDDRELIKIKPVKRCGCSCGRVFITQQSKEQHQKDTGHINKGASMTLTPEQTCVG